MSTLYSPEWDPELMPALSGQVLESFSKTAGNDIRDLPTLGQKIISSVEASVPYYMPDATSPTAAMRDTHAVDCRGRATLVHALASLYRNIDSHIVAVGNSHFFNVLLDPAATTNAGSVIIENWTDDDGTFGTLELITNPKQFSITDMLQNTAIYEGTISAARRLAVPGNTAGAEGFLLNQFFQVDESIEEGGFLLHLHPTDTPAAEEYDELQMEFLGQTAVTVYDPISSNDIADNFDAIELVAA